MKALIVSLLIMFFTVGVFGDTVVLKNGEKLKGLILDDYNDRIVLSTVNGEKILMKSDLDKAVYDSEVSALYKTAENLEKKNNYVKAYYAYEKVLEMDPEMDLARNRMVYLENYIGKNLKNNFYGSLYRRKKSGDSSERVNVFQKLIDEVGFSLKQGDRHAIISFVSEQKKGINKNDFAENDRIVSVWGKPTAYMDINSVADMLLEPGEVKISIEREYAVPIPEEPVFTLNPFASKLDRLIGARIHLKKAGFIVSSVKKNGTFYKSGIKNGDLICTIQGENVNYMPYSDIQRLIFGAKGGNTKVVIRRNVSFWKKEII